MPNNWLDDVFVSPRCYAYNGSLYCEDCGDSIKKNLAGTEDTGDSGTYPQGPYSHGGGEADSPYFCDCGSRCTNKIRLPTGLHVGCPLANPLTSDGARSLNVTIRSYTISTEPFRRQLARLLVLLYGPDGHDQVTDELAEYDGPATNDLLKILVKHKLHASGEILPGLLVGPEHVYVVVEKENLDVLVARLGVCPDGSYEDPEIVRVPARERTDYAPDQIVWKCIEDGTWD